MNAKEDIAIDKIDCEKAFDEFYYNDADVIPKDNVEQKYYNVLELEYGADFSAIKRAYKKLLKKYHPDLYANNPEKEKVAKEVTKQINEAYSYFEKKQYG